MVAALTLLLFGCATHRNSSQSNRGVSTDAVASHPENLRPSYELLEYATGVDADISAKLSDFVELTRGYDAFSTLLQTRVSTDSTNRIRSLEVYLSSYIESRKQFLEKLKDHVEEQRSVLFRLRTAHFDEDPLHFACAGASITNLDLSTNTALTEIYCRSTRITRLDTSQNTNLLKLTCLFGQLTNVDLSHNIKLETLTLHGNELRHLDVSRNTNLWLMICNENNLTSLNLSSNTVLTSLECKGNGLTNLNLRFNRDLNLLVCDDNRLSSLDLSANPTLHRLTCSENILTNLDLSQNTELTMLDCSSNRLTSLDISANTNLTAVNVLNNPLKEIVVWWTPPENVPIALSMNEFRYSGSPILRNPSPNR
ncbi:MAG: hypothetical protein C0404_11760 [Verrucomicrobia bacterium]|nr:hypothetical protein [Verrucomicrobiota bacterium]